MSRSDPYNNDWYSQGEGRDPGVLGGYGGGPVSQAVSSGWQNSLGKVLSNPYVNMGLGGLGGFLGARAHNQPEQWRQGIVESEIARRNQMQSLALPGMMRAQGYTAAQVPGMVSGMGGGNYLGGGGGGQLNMAPQGSRLGTIGGGIASGLGYVLGGPLGAMAGAGVGKILGKVGEGRRTANTFVQGVENPFGEAMARISAGQGGANELRQAYQAYLNGVNQFKSAGGPQATVAAQSMANPKLMSTYQTLARQLGVM